MIFEGCEYLEKCNIQKAYARLWLNPEKFLRDLSTYLPTYKELPKKIRERIDEATG
jgi:hypothetical protein